MTSRDFCYWLQGFFEIQSVPRPANSAAVAVSLTSEQVDTVRRHLAMVFKHEIDPSFPPEQIAELNEIHSRGRGRDDEMIRC